MATTVAERLFVDTNVLVHSAIASSPLHGTARAALESARATRRETWVSRQILREYLAVLSRPQCYSKPVSISLLTEDVRRFEAQFHVADGGPLVTAALLNLLQQVPTGGRQIHDANVVATMLAYGIGALLTDNVDDFVRFGDRISIRPLRA